MLGIQDSIIEKKEEAVIFTKHLQKALDTSRPSVSWQERMRLEKHYSDFTNPSNNSVRQQRSTLA